MNSQSYYLSLICLSKQVLNMFKLWCERGIRKTQGLLLNMVGPVAMIHELVSQARNNPENLDLSLILSAAAKGLQLLDNVNDHLANKCRAQVLSKIGQSYTSLSNEKRENSGKKPFGQQFEQRLKQRSKRPKQLHLRVLLRKASSFFSRGSSSARSWMRVGETKYIRHTQFRGEFYRSSRPFKGRDKATPTFTQSVPQLQ